MHNNSAQDKKFMSFDEQIDHLKNVKKLDIPDERFAREMLKRTCYYSLVAGYKDIYKDPSTGCYLKGTTFNDIVELYSFDEKLRSLFLQYLFRIEDQIKSLVSYYFSLKYGSDQSAYLTTTNYNYNKQTKNEIDTMLHIFNNLATKNTDFEAINHARNKHKNVPLWILVTAMTFGNIYKMYSALTNDLQKKVCSSYLGINSKELEMLLAVTSKFRNVCAHRERLFTYKANKSIPDMSIHYAMGIETDSNGEYLYGKNGLFAVVITLKYLLPPDIFREYKKELSMLLNHFLEKHTAHSSTEFLHIIGFPPNWFEI